MLGLERLLPARLGRPFRWLLGAAWLTNLGDGIAVAAGPLLVASLTTDPLPVALAALLRWAPPLLFGMHAGVLSDRLDRRRIVLVAHTLRVMVLGGLVAALVTGAGTVPVVLAALALLATAEVFADNTTATLAPMLVPREDLAVANARLGAGFITLNQLVGPSLGAVLFAAGRVWPLLAQLLLVVAGVLMLLRMRLPAAAGRADASGAGIWRDMVEGFRWTAGHPAVRTLVLTILIINIAFGAAWSVLVLYATQRLGLGAAGFGLLTTASAAGGLLGTVLYGRLTRHVSLGNILRAGLLIETFTHLGLAVTTSPGVALAIMFVFGAHNFAWGTTSVTVRQRAVPSHLQGRVNSVNTVCMYGSLVVGSAIGGVLAGRFGVAAPFWAAFGGTAVFVALLWRQLSNVAHADSAATADAM
ncbi:MFS transporter [Dactylosporangium sp. CA-139066]|uniref:MFS transporter n=1 Tax=Dactylosporangium sp. CA-139066 TaxID=3239930 RepID=UPI003D9403BC